MGLYNSKVQWTTGQRLLAGHFALERKVEERRKDQGLSLWKLYVVVWTIPTYCTAWGLLFPSLSRNTIHEEVFLASGCDSGLPLGWATARSSHSYCEEVPSNYQVKWWGRSPQPLSIEQNLGVSVVLKLFGSHWCIASVDTDLYAPQSKKVRT